MREQQVNLFSGEVLAQADAICVTTNGVVKKNGLAVMGRGVAKSAALRWPDLPRLLAIKLNASEENGGGNRVHELKTIEMVGHPVSIVSFPTKHDWRNDSDRQLIWWSAMELQMMASDKGWQHVFLPRPGCGNGKLSWLTQVKPVLSKIFDDRFIICHL